MQTPNKGSSTNTTNKTAVSTNNNTNSAGSVSNSSYIFSSNNSQSDGKNTLKRMEWEFKGQSYKFILNPEEYSQPEPHRIGVVNTKSGAWVDEFGAGVVTIKLRGTTGFKNGTSDPTTGFQKFKELRDLIRQYYSAHQPGVEIKDELIFHNYTDGEHWVVIPKTFNLMRSIARPLIYLYEIEMVCVRPAHIPKVSPSFQTVTPSPPTPVTTSSSSAPKSTTKTTTKTTTSSNTTTKTNTSSNTTNKPKVELIDNGYPGFSPFDVYTLPFERLNSIYQGNKIIAGNTRRNGVLSNSSIWVPEVMKE